MTTWIETDRGAVCGDCWHGCPRPAHWAGCDVDGCCCQCRDRDGGRARQLDDRPPVVLEGLARDLELERYRSAVYGADRTGEYVQLYAERWQR